MATLKQVKESLEGRLDGVNGRRRSRTVELEEALGLLETAQKLWRRKSLKAEGFHVVCYGGFVPNSYRYKATTTRVVVFRSAEGWRVTAKEVGAARSGGRGNTDYARKGVVWGKGGYIDL